MTNTLERIACVDCLAFMTISKIGVTVIDENHVAWNADLYVCSRCGTEVLGAFAEASHLEALEMPSWTFGTFYEIES